MEPRHAELPADREAALRRALRLEWITIAYLLSAAVLVGLVMGDSQAMRTAWAEDVLSLIPPAALLIAARIRDRSPNERFPYGYHRAVSIAYLCGSLALLGFGLLLLIEAVAKLLEGTAPPIPTIRVLGVGIWQGWLMVGALVYSAIPAVLLGRAKLPLARTLHDKALLSDAKMNKADWLAALAGIAGVLGLGAGLWWMDGVAAAAISLSIVGDGWTNLRQVILDLMDHRPTTVDRTSIDPLPSRVETEVRRLGWVKDARARLREEGHVYLGEVLVVPVEEDEPLLDRIAEADELLRRLDWRLHDVVIAPRRDLEGHPG